MTAQPKARDAEKTAARILDAARVAFTEKGFDGAGSREIAESAAVNVALINRYFGSKEGLFEAAVLEPLTVSPEGWPDGASMADALTDMLVNKPPEVSFDPIIAILRSIGSPVVGERVRAVVQDAVLGPMAEQVGGAHPRTDAGLILAVFAGYDVTARMLGLEIGQTEARGYLRQRLRALLAVASGEDGKGLSAGGDVPIEPPV